MNFYCSGVGTGTEKEKTGMEIVIKVDGTDTERKIVGLILENWGITQEQIAKSMGMSKNGIRYAMGKFKRKGCAVQ